MYSEKNSVLEIDGGTCRLVRNIRSRNAAHMVPGAMVDLPPYASYGVTDEDIDKAIQQAGLDLVSRIPATLFAMRRWRSRGAECPLRMFMCFYTAGTLSSARSWGLFLWPGPYKGLY